MADDLTAFQPPRGLTRCTAAEVEVRVGEVVALLAQGHSRRDVLQYAAEKWGMAERTVDDYLRRARHEMAEAIRGDVDEMVGELAGWYRQQYKTAIEAKDIGFALRAGALMARLLGLDHAARVGSGGGSGKADPDAKAASLLRGVYGVEGEGEAQPASAGDDFDEDGEEEE